LDLALAVVNGISSEGKNLVMGFALIAKETTDNYVWLLKQIREMNGNQDPGVIMTEYDTNLCLAIE
jgi:hypothetical protein